MINKRCIFIKVTGNTVGGKDRANKIIIFKIIYIIGVALLMTNVMVLEL
jgi:hypothetical protein